MTEPKLDCCRHCGSKAKFTKVVDEEAEDAGGWFVICLNEKCAMTTGTRLGDDPRALLAEIWNRRPAPDLWRPIWTAPHDGSAILLGARCGAWIGKWLPVYGSGYQPKNPWQSLMLNHDHMGEKWQAPTHWAPLPPPPSQESGRG